MNDLFKYGLLAIGGWMLYEYFYGTPSLTTSVASTTVPPLNTQNTSQPGAQAGSGSNVVPPTSTASTSLLSTSVQTQLQQLANSDLAANPNQGGLNVDQWNYYLNQITGVQISPVQGEQLIQLLGEDDSTRGKIIPLNTYLTALSAAGLGRVGMGMVRGLGMLRTRSIW